MTDKNLVYFHDFFLIYGNNQIINLECNKTECCPISKIQISYRIIAMKKLHFYFADIS